MASTALLTSLLLLALSLLSIGADARPGVHFHPCLFITYTVTSTSAAVVSSDTGSLAAVVSSDPAALSAFHTTASEDQKHSISLSVYWLFWEFRRLIPIERPGLPAAFGVSSFQERAKDILFVVVSLLFVSGCGALAVATLYLAWSHATNRHEMCGDDYDGEASPMDMGYVSIAVQEEGYEGRN